MNYNCAIFGPGAKLVCKFATHVIARDLAQTSLDEQMCLDAATRGIRLKRSCEVWYGNKCTNLDWNDFTNNIKILARENVSDEIYQKLI